MSAAAECAPLTVVLVEDDDADAKALRRALARTRAAGPMLRALDGVDALALLRGAHGPLPDHYVVLADINMPRMDGLEFIRHLRADPELRRAVVFFLTTSDADEDRAAAYGAHAAGYVLKQRAGRDYALLIGILQRYWKTVTLPEITPRGTGDHDDEADRIDRR